MLIKYSVRFTLKGSSRKSAYQRRLCLCLCILVVYDAKTVRAQSSSHSCMTTISIETVKLPLILLVLGRPLLRDAPLEM